MINTTPVFRTRSRFFANPAAAVGLLLVGLMLGCALFAPLLPLRDPIHGSLRMHLQPPTLTYLFGTDDLGRDIFSRVIFGAQISLRIGVLAEASALTLGIFLGLLAGYYRGIFEILIMRMVDIIMAFPLLIVAIALVSVLGTNEFNLIIALSIVTFPAIARLVYSQTLRLKEADYVLTARSLGASDIRIMFRHILPNMVGTIIVYASLGIAGIILSEAALSFLGLGSAAQGTPSWGGMLTESRDYIRSAWWMPFFPGVAILLTVLGFNLLGDGLRDALDVRS